jgi:hypothetical protein
MGKNGTYIVTTVITDLADGSSASLNPSLTVNQSGNLAITPATGLTGTENVALSNVTLATFTDADSNHSASAYSSSTVLWGDGTAASSATISGTGPFTLAGSHTYQEAGTYRIVLTVNDSDGASAVAVASITVGDASLSATAQSLSPTAGLPLSAVTVATFTTANTAEPASDFAAQVNWGDGTPVTGAAVTGTAGSYSVASGHLYTTAGSYTAVVTITDVDGATATANDSVTVSNPSSTLTANAISATEAASWSGTAAVFTPAAGIAGHSFVASLGWGEGGVTYGTLTSNGQGGFNITGSHTYAEDTTAGGQTLTVTVMDDTAGITVASATASVAVRRRHALGHRQRYYRLDQPDHQPGCRRLLHRPQYRRTSK